MDIKFGFVVPWSEILKLLAADWGTAQMSAAQGAGYNPVPAGQLPDEFMVMAIGVKQDHIFQGIIYGKPSHPLLRQAIQHAFCRQVFATKADMEYMIFCKFLWDILKRDMGTEPAVGWNISRTYGPIYLCLERYDGHFVTRNGTAATYTRCWHWQKGFQGDPSTKERTDKMLWGLDGVSSTAHTGKGHSLRRRSRSMSLTPSTTEMT